METARESKRKELAELIRGLSENDQRVAFMAVNATPFNQVERLIALLRDHQRNAADQPLIEYINGKGFCDSKTLQHIPDEVVQRISKDGIVDHTLIEFADDASRRVPSSNAKTVVSNQGTGTQTITDKILQHLNERNRFEHVKSLGGGGMGDVDVMRDRVFLREVVRKTPKDNSPDSQHRFARELRIQGSLVHANIPPVYEAGILPDGTYYFDMLKIEGVTLAEYLDEARKSRSDAHTMENRVRILADACKAIAFAASRGVVHRDLKPQNIMLGTNGVVYVLDWGLARYVDEQSIPANPRARHAERHELDESFHTIEEGIIQGTPSYFAPEQASGGIPLNKVQLSKKELKERFSVDEKSDQFALGLILYELLTCTPYWRFSRQPVGNTELMVLLRQMAEGSYGPRTGSRLTPLPRGKKELYVFPPVRPRALNPDIPPALESIVLKATAHDKRERYHSTNGLLADLEAFLAGKQVSAHQYDWRARYHLWRKKHEKLDLGIKLTGAAGLAIAVIASTLSKRAAENELRAAQAERKNEQLELAMYRKDKINEKVDGLIAFGEDIFYRRKGKLDDAIIWFDQAVAANATNRHVPFFKRGLAYYHANQLEKAIEDFQTATTKSKESGKPDIQSVFYHAMSVIQLHDSPRSANKILQDIIDTKEYQGHPLQLLAQSIDAFAKDDFKSAIKFAKEAKARQELWETEYHLAMYHSVGIPSAYNVNTSERVKALTAELGIMHGNKRYESALEHATNALKLNRDEWRILFLLARIHEMRSEFDTARDYADRILERGVIKTHGLYAIKARSFLAYGKLDDADKTLQTAEHELGRLDWETHLIRGNLHNQRREFEAAEKDFAASLRDKENASAYAYRGLARQEQGLLEDALKDHNKSIEIDNVTGDFFMLRGMCFERLRRADDAVRDYEQSIKLGHAPAYVLLGGCYARQGKRDEARRLLQEFLKTSPPENQRRDAEDYVRKLLGE